MNIKWMGTRLWRVPTLRIIWCRLLLLIVLGYFDAFDAARVEAAWTWRVDKLPAYVGTVEILENIKIFNHDKQKALMTRVCNDIGKFDLRNVWSSFPCFSWPNRPYGGSPCVFSAFSYDVTNGAAPIAIMAKDDGISNSVTARARRPSGSDPIILELIAEKQSGEFYRFRGRRYQWMDAHNPRHGWST